MKAYLYLEDDPYLQRHSGGKALPIPDTPFPLDDEDAQSRIYGEFDLLPDDLPAEYRDRLPEKVIFHMHQFTEIVRLEKGEALYIADKTLHLVEPGEIIVFNSFVPHTWLFLKEDMQIVDYSFSNILLSTPLDDFTSLPSSELADNSLFLNIWHTRPLPGKFPDIVSSDGLVMKEEFWSTLINSSLRCTCIKRETPLYERFSDLLVDIDRECTQKQFAYQDILYAKLIEFFAQLFRLHSEKKMRSVQTKPRALSDALEYISKNLHQNLRLEDVAAHCYFTPQYFSTYFKKHTGMTFSQYINDLRLEHVLKDLIRSDRSILDIAFQCGFNSKTNFYRAWYSKYHISPLKIRNMYQR